MIMPEVAFVFPLRSTYLVLQFLSGFGQPTSVPPCNAFQANSQILVYVKNVLRRIHRSTFVTPSSQNAFQSTINFLGSQLEDSICRCHYRVVQSIRVDSANESVDHYSSGSDEPRNPCAVEFEEALIFRRLSYL